MRANISIDVSLLAIALAMYFTKQDNRMILVLVAALVSHVIITSDFEGPTNGHSRRVYLVGTGAEDLEDLDDSDDLDKSEDPEVEEEQEESTEVMEDSLDTDQGPEPIEEDFLTPKKQFKTTVSSGVFERTISTPQTQLTSAIFPSSSSEANGKLANARGSFFETLVS